MGTAKKYRCQSERETNCSTCQGAAVWVTTSWGPESAHWRTVDQCGGREPQFNVHHVDCDRIKENGTGCKPVQEKGLKSDPLPAKS